MATTPLPKLAEPLPTKSVKAGLPSPTERKPNGMRAQAEKPEKKSSAGLVIGLILLLVGGGGGAYYWFVLKPDLDGTATAVVPPRPDSTLAADSGYASLAANANPSGTPATTAPPARDSAAPAATPAATAADSGTLKVGLLPRGSAVMVDGRAWRTNPGKLPVGEHDVLVTAPGYDNFRQRVRIAKGQQNDLAPDLRRLGAAAVTTTPPPNEITPIGGGRTASVNCSEPGATYNINNACWDRRPRPSDVTPPAVPVADPNLQGARPSIMNIHVSAQGTTLEVRAVRASNDPAFEDAAKRYARAMQWVPASKNGTAVHAWVQQQLVPTAP